MLQHILCISSQFEAAQEMNNLTFCKMTAKSVIDLFKSHQDLFMFEQHHSFLSTNQQPLPLLTLSLNFLWTFLFEAIYHKEGNSALDTGPANLGL